jgi:Kinesin motor domain
MLGDEGSSGDGIVGRSIRMMFEKMVQISALNRNDTIVSMSVEVLEVYNEKVFDLLDKKDSNQGLRVTSDGADGHKVVDVKSLAEVMRILSVAQKQRCVQQTGSNESSSRSHLIFTLNFKVGNKQWGKLNICDLAGSERTKKSGVWVSKQTCVPFLHNSNPAISRASDLKKPRASILP